MLSRSVKIGSQCVMLNIPAEKLIPGQRESLLLPITDLSETVARILDSPLDFPPLRRAFTPDDQVAILIQEEMNSLPEILSAILRQVFSAGVKQDNVTLLVPPREPGTATSWLGKLPIQLQACRIEEHQSEASHISYLASTEEGRRIYLNRTLVDADQVIILGSVRFDPIFGVASGLADLFPIFSDQATKHELLRVHSGFATDAKKSPAIWREAKTVGWLLGMPFVVSVLEGSGNDVLFIWAGNADSVRQKAEMALREEFQFHVAGEVDLVIGTISNLPEHQSFALVATAAQRASCITRTDGAVAILSEVRPKLPRGVQTMQFAPNPSSGLSVIRQETSANALCWWQLASALEKSRLYLHSRIPSQVLEDLWIIPLEKPNQVHHLINQARSLVLIEDLHRSLPLLGRK